MIPPSPPTKLNIPPVNPISRIGASEETVAVFLAEDEAVIDTLNQRAEFARELMARLGARGVPTLARVTDTGVEKIDSRWLFEDVANVSKRLYDAG